MLINLEENKMMVKKIVLLQMMKNIVPFERVKLQ